MAPPSPIHTYVCIYIYVCVCVFVYVCVYVCVCVCVCNYMIITTKLPWCSHVPLLHRKRLLYFAKAAKATPAISDLKKKLAALELEQAQTEAAEQELAEASALAAKIAALEEQKMKKAAAKKSADVAAAAEVGCHFSTQQSHCV